MQGCLLSQRPQKVVSFFNRSYELTFLKYFYISRIMEMFEATEAFSSLSQETRLRVFKLLVEYGREGLAPGKIAETLNIPDNTLSFHLSHMAKAGLVTSKKKGRSITYFANQTLIKNLIGYLNENCCHKESKPKKKALRTESCC